MLARTGEGQSHEGVAGRGSGPVLDVADLHVAYPRRTGRQGSGWHEAVRDVSFTVGPGEAFGLVGESGSGKSSVALAVLRYLPRAARAGAGRLAFEGRDLLGLSVRQLRGLRGVGIGAVYQHPGSALNPGLTIGRQIGEGLRVHRGATGAEAREAAEDLLARVRVRNPRGVLDLYPHELSGGMQQRAVIAMAIALDPALLVLDEPTTALDAGVRAEIVSILEGLRRERGTALLLISHDLGLVARLADRVGVMQEGRIVEAGPANAVLTRPTHPAARALALGVLGAPSVPRPAPAGPALLRCRGLAHGFGDTPVLEGIDLEIAAGETFGLIGESGSGKSTLARIVTGLEAPCGGTIELAGRTLAPRVARRRLADLRDVQMVFQSPDATLNPRRSVRRILAQPLRRLAGLHGPAIHRRILDLLAAVRLDPALADARPAAMSGGQRQRVAIARAFAGAPRLVVLDEPTSALDVSVQAAVLGLLGELQRERGTSYLLISHDLAVVRALADQVGVLHRGRLVETGPAARVLTAPEHPYTKLLLAAAAPPAAPARPPQEAQAG